jgi:hypothetical protein
MAADLPALWDAASTRPEDRKAILRHLIERAIVAVRGNSEYVDRTIVWAGGGTSRHELVRPVRNFDELRDHERLLERIAERRRSGLAARRIAERLNAEDWNSCGGRGRFTKDVVIGLLRRFGRAGIRPRSRESAAVLGPREWWASELARHLGMDPKTLGKWILRGWVAARRKGEGSGPAGSSGPGPGPTDARKATARRFGRSDRSAQFFVLRNTPVGASGWGTPRLVAVSEKVR